MSLINENDRPMWVSAIVLMAIVFAFVMIFSKTPDSYNSYAGRLEGSNIRMYCDYGHGNLIYVGPSGDIEVVPNGCSNK